MISEYAPVCPPCVHLDPDCEHTADYLIHEQTFVESGTKTADRVPRIQVGSMVEGQSFRVSTRGFDSGFYRNVVYIDVLIQSLPDGESRMFFYSEADNTLR